MKLRVHSRICAAAAVILTALVAAPACASLIIDDFSQGAVDLFVQNLPGQAFVYQQSVETGLDPAHTIGGQRLTWVQTGLDSDPAAARLQSAGMWFRLDNDDTRAGLKYLGLGGVDLTGGGQLNRLAFDGAYDQHGIDGYYAAVAIQLRDAAGHAQLASLLLDQHVAGVGDLGVDGNYGLPLTDWGIVDLRHIQDIEFTFAGGVMFSGWFSMANIAVVPEPASLMSLILLSIARKR